MKNQVIILDNSCILGVHRLLKIISEPFEKLILPSDVGITAWPNRNELTEFIVLKEINAGNKNAFESFYTGKSKFLEIIDIEREKSFEFIEKLKSIGKLEICDYSEWPVDYSKSEVKENAFLKFNNQILLKYISLPEEKKKLFKLSSIDIRVVSGTIYQGNILKSFHPYINSYLFPDAKTEHTYNYTKLIPKNLNPPDIEEFIELSLKGKLDELELIRKYKEISSLSGTEKIIFTIFKELGEIAFPILSPINALVDIYQVIQSENSKTKDKYSSIIKTTVNSISNKNIQLIEEMIKFLLEKPYNDRYRDF